MPPPSERQTIAIIVGCALGLAALARLPQFLGGEMMADGDEAILGLMAKRTAEGREFPLFFWGQRYGLSVFECAAAAGAFGVFGASAEAMKGAMLAIWLAGFGFLILAAARWGGARAAGIAAVLFAVAPAWGAWSMKARGGYLTAFLFSTIALWILGGLKDPEVRAGRAKSAALGGCFALALAGQMIWAPMLAPFGVALAVWRPKQVDWPAAAASFVAIFGGAALAGFALESGHWAPNIFDGSRELHALARLPIRLWEFFSGCFQYQWLLEPGPGARLAAGAWLALMAWAVAMPAATLRRRREISGEQWLALSVFSVALFSIFLGYYTFGRRYLLPLTAPLAILAGIRLARATEAGGARRAAAALLLALAAAGGAAAHWEFRKKSFTREEIPREIGEREALERLIAELNSAGVAGVYTPDVLLQWEVMFASREAIPTRSFALRDRRPKYGEAVEEARRSGKRTALVLDAPPAQGAKAGADAREFPEGTRFVSDRFAYVLDPSAELLRKYNFEIAP